MSEEEKSRLTSTVMASMMIMLDQFDEIKHTKLYSKKLKMLGNRFHEELVKITEPIESELLQETEQAQEVSSYVTVLEQTLKGIATMKGNNLMLVHKLVSDIKEKE
jgi:hypothetical protein